MIDFSQVTDILLGNTPVEQVSDSQGNVLWSSAPVVLPDYFYVEDVSGSDNTLSITKDNVSAPTIEVFKSTDKVNWTSMGQTDTTAITTTIPANGKLYLKATTNNWRIDNYKNIITASGNHNVGGNIMSLLYGDEFVNQTTLSATYTFSNLFLNNTKLVDASKLELPPTTLTAYCYAGMFGSCTSLTTAPMLPATTLADYCYSGMFTGCTALTTAPALPVTTLAEQCYSGMFYHCSSLTTAPALPATTLAQSCYNNMFNGCSSLTTAPVLSATTLAQSCYNSMFNSCTSLTTAPMLPATTLADNCYESMFMGCTSLTTAPATLPATTLTASCYSRMFMGCKNLNSVTTYAQNISASSCLRSWLAGVSQTGDFFNLGGVLYPSGNSGIPSGWTVHTSL